MSPRRADAIRLFDRTVRPILARVRDEGDRLVERRLGVATHGEVPLERLGLAAPNRVYYKPLPWSTLARVLRPRDVRPYNVFLDLGAGKGRAVILAARRPFRRVIGVELSPELSAAARANLVRVRERLRCPHVEIVTSDVLAYDVPDDVTVVFLYNPFRGEVFARAIERVLASVDRRPRRVLLIYRNPIEHEGLMSTGRASLVRRTRGWRPTPEWARSNAIHVYELMPTRPVAT